MALSQPTKVPALHPGKMLLEYIEDCGWTQSEFAKQAGMTKKTVSLICRGKAPIRAKTALKLEDLFNRPAVFWLTLQCHFDLERERKKL